MGFISMKNVPAYHMISLHKLVREFDRFFFVILSFTITYKQQRMPVSLGAMGKGYINLKRPKKLPLMYQFKV